MGETTTMLVDFEDLAPILEAITTQFSIANIATIVGAIVGASVGFVFFWWGARKLFSRVTKAATKGKASI